MKKQQKTPTAKARPHAKTSTVQSKSKPTAVARIVKRQSVTDSHFRTTLRRALKDCIRIVEALVPTVPQNEEEVKRYDVSAVKQSDFAFRAAGLFHLGYAFNWLYAAFEANDRVSCEFAHRAKFMREIESMFVARGEDLSKKEDASKANAARRRTRAKRGAGK